MLGKLFCLFGSHDMELLQPHKGILESSKRCRRCGKFEEGLMFRRDTPEMPKCKPPKKEG